MTLTVTMRWTVLFFILRISCADENSFRRNLRVLGFLPMSGQGWVGGAGCLPAIRMAIDDINARTDILGGYNLTYHWIDTQCNPGVAVNGMFKELYTSLPYVLLLGAGCSTESTATAQVSHLWNLTQLSYGSSSPILSDRKRFPRFFRLAGPDQMLNPSRIALMKKYNWRKVATINQALEFFSVVIDDFVQKAKNSDVTIISQEIFENDPMSRVENLKKHDARIIMTALYEDKARLLLCSAYKIGLYGPKIIWVFVGWFSEEFWRANLHEVDCSEEQMQAAAEGAILTTFYTYNPMNVRGVANLTGEEFYTRYFSSSYYDSRYSKYDMAAPQCFDHMYVSALALDCADRKLLEIGHEKTLDQFDYDDGDIGQIIFDCMGNVSMTGTSGNIEFDKGADPKKNVKIERITDGKKITFGTYKMDTDPNRFDWIGDGIIWKDGNVPRDSTILIIKEVTIPMAVYITLATMAGLGILMAFGFFVFNVVYRKQATVKLSSPNINNILLLGCVLCYVTVFMKPTESSSAIICKARTFSLTLGFTTAFGALFSKTWRVYKIFTNKKLLRMSIKDVQLLGIISGLLSVVLVVLVTWEIVSPQYLIKEYLDKEAYFTNDDTEIRPFVRKCQSEYSTYFSWVLYAIEGVLLTFGAFLAWETRHIKIAALNDSRHIGVCLYNVVVLSGVGLALTLLLNQQVVILYGITSGCLLIATTVTQVVVFIPKVLAVYHRTDAVEPISSASDAKQPSGSKMKTKINVTSKAFCNTHLTDVHI